MTENQDQYQTEITKIMGLDPKINGVQIHHHNDESMVYKDMIEQIEEIEMSEEEQQNEEAREVLRISVELGDETKIIRILEG